MLSLSVSNLVITIINIFVLYSLLRKFLYKPVMGIIEKRDEMIKTQLETAKKTEQDAMQLHLKGLAVSEITGCNGCHSFFLHIPEEITTDFLKFIKYRFLTYGILPHIGPHCK